MVYVINTCGYGSFGDDCYFDTLRKHLSAAWPSSKIVVNRVDGVPFSPEKQEAVILGGGGILYRHIDQSGSDSLRYFLRYPAVMQVFGKKSFALSVGVQGPLNSEHLKPYIEVLNAMGLCTVRDSESAGILRQAGVSVPVLQSADISYLMDLPATRPRQIHNKPVLGVAASQPDKGVIYAESQGFEARLHDALHALEGVFDIHFYSFNKRTDDAVAEAFTGKHQHTSYNPAAKDAVPGFTESLADSDIFLTSRFHGVTLCAGMGIPFVSIGAAGEKVARESHALEHPFHLPYSAEACDIASAIREAWANRPAILKNLKSTAANQRARVQQTFEALRTCN